MGRGLSEVQRGIVKILSGNSGLRWPATGAVMTTGELVDALQALDLIRSDATWKYCAFSVRRACRSLERRGILSGRLDRDIDRWIDTLFWSLVERPADSGGTGIIDNRPSNG